MLDPKLLRETPELVKASQRARGADEGLVDAWHAADSNWRSLNTKYDLIRAEQKNLSKAIGPLQGKLKGGDSAVQDELAQLMQKATALADELSQLAVDRDAAEAAANKIMGGFANIVDADARSVGKMILKLLRPLELRATLKLPVLNQKIILS